MTYRHGQTRDLADRARHTRLVLVRAAEENERRLAELEAERERVAREKARLAAEVEAVRRESAEVSRSARARARSAVHVAESMVATAATIAVVNGAERSWSGYRADELRSLARDLQEAA